MITEFSAGFPTGSPRGIVTGPDGNLWVATAGGDGATAKVTKAGDVTEFPVPTPGDPSDITVGPDKNLWEGAVDVRDYTRRRTALVRAGHTYVAKSRRALRREARQQRRHSRR